MAAAWPGTDTRGDRAPGQGSVPSSHGPDILTPSYPGVILISLALCVDAVIGNVQEKAMKLHSASNSEMVSAPRPTQHLPPGERRNCTHRGRAWARLPGASSAPSPVISLGPLSPEQPQSTGMSAHRCTVLLTAPCHIFSVTHKPTPNTPHQD